MHKAFLSVMLAVGSLSTAFSQPVRVEGGLVSGLPGKDPSILTFKRDTVRGVAGGRSALARTEASGGVGCGKRIIFRRVAFNG